MNNYVSDRYHILTFLFIHLLCIMSSFKQNHVIERIWVEVNQRVNYPIKQALNEMADDEQINCDEPTCIMVQYASSNSWNKVIFGFQE